MDFSAEILHIQDVLPRKAAAHAPQDVQETGAVPPIKDASEPLQERMPKLGETAYSARGGVTRKSHANLHSWQTPPAGPKQRTSRLSDKTHPIKIFICITALLPWLGMWVSISFI
jgi:hypothetical protein